MPSASPLILTVNAGSSSLKAAAYRSAGPLVCCWRATLSGIGSGRARLALWDETTGDDATHAEPVKARDQSAALKAVMRRFESRYSAKQIAIIGHRVVHGGDDFIQAQRIDRRMVAKLKELVVLAPDHLPQAIAAIEFFRRSYPRVDQMAAFDTSFHADMPERARSYALPRRFAAKGMHRFGFHGLSYTYVVEHLRQVDTALASGRLVVAHLGSGASMAAIAAGRSLDTTMGFSPDGGLVMSSRAGDVDAALVLYLIEEREMKPAAVRALLNQRAGLKGVSGISADMQTLLADRATQPDAALAVDMFCYRIQRYLGSYAAAMGGLDGVVFTGGIGENAAEIRAQICDGLTFLGIELDHHANATSSAVISSAASRVRMRIVRTDEDSIIAREAKQLLALSH